MPVLAVSQGREGRIVLLGLSMKDILQLSEGTPIEGSLEKVTGVKGLKLVVVMGPTDEEIKTMISKDIPTTTLPREGTAEELTKMLEDAEKGEG